MQHDQHLQEQSNAFGLGYASYLYPDQMRRRRKNQEVLRVGGKDTHGYRDIRPSIPRRRRGTRDATQTHGSVEGECECARLHTFSRGRRSGRRIAVRLDAREEHAGAAAQVRRRWDVAGQSGGQHRVVQHAAVVHQAAPDLQTTEKAEPGISIIIIINHLSNSIGMPNTNTQNKKERLQLSMDCS